MSMATLASIKRLRGPALVDRLNEGINASAFRSMAAALGLSMGGLASFIGLSERTLRSRVKLDAQQTEKVYRVYRIMQRATEVFESEAAAIKWMLSSQRALEGRMPIEMMVQDVGFAEVMNVLNAIEDGGYL
jgi:putative toxin-antitoxin system antitoxin component (TIGR02293 family)